MNEHFTVIFILDSLSYVSIKKSLQQLCLCLRQVFINFKNFEIHEKPLRLCIERHSL